MARQSLFRAVDGGRASKNHAVKVVIHVVDGDGDRRSVEVLQGVRTAAIRNRTAAEKWCHGLEVF